MRNTRKGKLIVIEGIDGSGKTTLLNAVAGLLEHDGYRVLVTAWGGSDMIGGYITTLAKEGKRVTNRALSCLYAADFLLRLQEQIIPELEKGTIVLCDRYYYTQLVRDAALGLPKQWSRSLFTDVLSPDRIIYMDVSLETSRARVQHRIDEAIENQKDVSGGSLMGSLMLQGTGMVNQKYREDGEPMSKEDKERMMLQYQHNILESYTTLFQKMHALIRIDGEKNPQVVLESVYTILRDFLGIGNKPPAQL